MTGSTNAMTIIESGRGETGVSVSVRLDPVTVTDITISDSATAEINE